MALTSTTMGISPSRTRIEAFTVGGLPVAPSALQPGKDGAGRDGMGWDGMAGGTVHCEWPASL